MSTWPDSVWDLALPLYARSLLVHCLSYYSRWLWETMTADSDLSATHSTAEFARLVRSTLTEAGLHTAGVSAHSMRVGAATTLVQGSLSMPTLSRVLRHRDQRSSEANVHESVHVAETTAAMRAAAHRSSSCSGRGADGLHRGRAAPPQEGLSLGVLSSFEGFSPAEALVVIQLWTNIPGRRPAYPIVHDRPSMVIYAPRTAQFTLPPAALAGGLLPRDTGQRLLGPSGFLRSGHTHYRLFHAARLWDHMRSAVLLSRPSRRRSASS